MFVIFFLQSDGPFFPSLFFRIVSFVPAFFLLLPPFLSLNFLSSIRHVDISDNTSNGILIPWKPFHAVLCGESYVHRLESFVNYTAKGNATRIRLLATILSYHSLLTLSWNAFIRETGERRKRFVIFVTRKLVGALNTNSDTKQIVHLLLQHRCVSSDITCGRITWSVFASYVDEIRNCYRILT